MGWCGVEVLETLTNQWLPSTELTSLLSQVDESLLTDDYPPPPPYVAMSLPGGGVMNLPMDTVRTQSAGSPTDSTTTTATASTALGQDVLSVTAGEPATHFNLDQLLNIVQSFQLDTTHAAHGPELGQAERKV